ncbi:N-acetylneuraminate synthase [Ciceribacter sp. RN22]|uniref:N-acetylneuraminate synthase n=1 Tax=Ciceribacter sp. RN22 TaxID=2954932 RepID=UPI002092B30C|nr:N-acetylneuraminate synthase [Ciceribacter sp. RN22]MCO6179016.1 N-acetylneuraminate synthase [Ciceribacter sp. RN22]
MNESFSIADKTIGRDSPCFIIAEIGVNHNGDPDLAAKLVTAARNAGADAVKFQTFRADRLVVRATPTAEYQKANTNLTDQHAMLAALELSEAAHLELLAQCRREGIIFLSSPFDLDSIDMLDRLDVPVFKVPSPDCVSQSYLERMGSKKRPVILSTGMCDLEEVAFGVKTLTNAGSEHIALLHCTSCYPAPPEELNLRVIPALADITGLPVGYSDHSDGIAVSIAAVALGACVIEKHMTLDRNLPGPDHKASLEPDEFTAMVSGIRNVERALGRPVKAPQPCETSARQLGRRSVAVSRDLPAGHRLTPDDLILLRPGTGLAPRMERALVGRVLSRPVSVNTLIAFEDLA